ncbi:MAG TPA: hypothetical protein V6C81_11720 [Planktothrix sp.]
MANSSKRLSVSLEELTKAGIDSGVEPAQTEQIWHKLSLAAAASRSGAAQIAWYFGAAITLVAMFWLMAQATTSWGYGGGLCLSLVYTAGFAFAGSRLVDQQDLRVPGGLLYSLATAMTPVSIYAVLQLLKTGGSEDVGVLLMMLATVAVGAFFTLRTRISFVCVPPLLAGGVAAITIDNLLDNGHGWASWNHTVLVYGLIVTVLSFMVDRKTREDYAFWGYFVGACSVFFSLTLVDRGELGYALYALGGLFSIFLAMILSRRVFAFLGASAVLIYIGHLMSVVFDDSLAFPLALTALGALTIYLGNWYRKNSERIEKTALSIVPEGLRKLLPSER